MAIEERFILKIIEQTPAAQLLSSVVDRDFTWFDYHSQASMLIVDFPRRVPYVEPIG
jgi:hypothetical protein